ncbi:phosphoribosylaminoimidazolesuccinocarboxamide synthase [Rhodoplanes sp. TEM]|uniref:Phosphoribosylaminoimidazole-succinocarboxamide synthase n=1 Tax=Rhodoplanes tepidamans TaxID=200616 RepID=A0ABT5JA47_RHOTP|nr:MULTISPECIES: phosphoribosylaminoimidazolesuccinocarboxamide synthase [Rhodoplanes]MDC7786527.1 phosphoribosylaminoimidazolesuccinocarboxamide synthase [Rhodoplanes tepidamans]MDC7983135.1 phosphoribosylaminoimidazolesuccinocarboxamide synthase [Rhodoplanes sp. TEM]MDQ0357593.1 phosphoribosylaminoimidazole-succinocarboxamide synthase [Rhodoplanes tepidamans]
MTDGGSALETLRRTDFDDLGERIEGKVRDIYVQPDRLVLVTTDRHSSFDRIVAHIPGKGEVLNRTAAFWCEETRDILPNHVIALPDPNVTVARRCTPLRIEIVMRGYLTGVTSTSIWTHYQAGRRDFGSFVLPDGMRKNERLPVPVFTPSTKEATHDETITPAQVLERGLLSKDLLEQVEDAAQKLFRRGQEIALSRGLILVDTKYEMGLDADSRLILIDEIHTPDSSRWWMADSYEARFAAGQEPEYFDKEFLRRWFVDHCDPYKDAVIPAAPAELVAELSARYQQIFHRLTGQTLTPRESGRPLAERIADNLAAYRI